jgi:hypothetical protein
MISRIMALFLLLLPFPNSEKILDTLLDSSSLVERRAAFEEITSSTKEYVPLIRNRLESLANGHVQTNVKSLDRLLYLSAFIKDKSLLPPIESLWANNNFLPHYCEYSCPLVFALTINATEGLWKPPENINKVLMRQYDLYPEIRIASEISLEPTPQEQRAHDRYQEEAAKKSEKQLIEQAGPQTQDVMERLAAALQLEYSVSTSKYLKELYWLAIQEVKPDGANEFRLAIYMAIYRAEKARRMGR